MLCDGSSPGVAIQALGEGLGKNRRLHVTVWPDAAEQLDHAAGFQVLRMNFIDHRANG